MSDVLQVVLALWGAILATVLGIIELLKHLRDKLRIVATADLSCIARGKEADSKGALFETNHGPNELLLAITAANHGKQAFHITACLFDEMNGNLQHMIPSGLLALLKPSTQVQVEIQRE